MYNFYITIMRIPMQNKIYINTAIILIEQRKFNYYFEMSNINNKHAQEY
jgi:hypothetical protein